MLKFSRKSDHSLLRYKSNYGKCPISQGWRIHKKFLDRDLEADDFQNSISSSLCSGTSVVNFREDLFSSFYVKFPNKQTNKQTRQWSRQTPGITPRPWRTSLLLFIGSFSLYHFVFSCSPILSSRQPPLLGFACTCYGRPTYVADHSVLPLSLLIPTRQPTHQKYTGGFVVGGAGKIPPLLLR